MHLEIVDFYPTFIPLFTYFMKKIIEFYDKANSSCSFWRGRGPLLELEKQDKIKLTQGFYNEDWSELRRHDIAFMQRPMAEFCAYQALMCKDLGLSVWVDLDDWVHIPEHHPMYSEYMKIFNAKSFKQTLAVADVISVTNPTMKTMYSEFYPKIANKITIIPNALNDNVYKIKPQSSNKYLFWRGGDHKIEDIKPHLSDLISLLMKNPDWTLFAAGYDFKVFSVLKNYQYIGDLPIHHYMAAIQNLAPGIFINPLLDNDFNKCKSNIAWIEATMAGGVIAQGNSEFMSVLEMLMANPESREHMYAISKINLTKNFLLDSANDLRMNIINKL